jgi:hypothetical protein
LTTSARALDRMVNDRADRTLTQETAHRGFVAQEYAPAAAMGSPVLEIGDDRFADIGRQG